MLGSLLFAGCAKKETAPSDNGGATEASEAANANGQSTVAAPKPLKAPIADGVTVPFAYTEVVDMTMPATGGGDQRTVTLWVKELTPSAAAAMMAGAVAAANFEKVAPEMHQYKFKKGTQTINVNTLDFKPGDKNGLGTVDVTIITQ